ncbi:MAG: hypothetical protein ACYDG3_06165 [Bacillati bacterium]
MDNLTVAPAQHRALEFGIYRDGDNNLDAVQETALGQALQTSAADHHIEFTVQDTTALRLGHGDTVSSGPLHTNEYTIAGGRLRNIRTEAPHEMSDASNLAKFVAHTLDNAQRSAAKQTWIDLVDHGGGDGGGLQTSDGHVMSMPGIAKAIAEGVALHAKEHPEDAARGVDGVVANQCLMSTLGFADALSHAGVKYLAASPETMVAPGAPSSIAHTIAADEGHPGTMARQVVGAVMSQRYGVDGQSWGPAAAFDVLDLDAAKLARVERSVKALNDTVVHAAQNPDVRDAVREDAKKVDGMVRFPGSKGLPWQADRPAMAFYDTLAGDTRLDPQIRARARDASQSVGNMVLAHKESSAFGPFGGADYADAAGPTVHVPTSPKEIDPWAPAVSETNNAFYHRTDEDALARITA